MNLLSYITMWNAGSMRTRIGEVLLSAMIFRGTKQETLNLGSKLHALALYSCNMHMIVRSSVWIKAQGSSN